MSKSIRRLSAAGISAAAVTAIGTTPVHALTVGAYAVANHSSCGAGNIPGTIAELDKFFASTNLPTDFQKNFYWKDGRVKQNEWAKDGDYRPSSEATSGFDGADASLLTYIASHGVTNGGVYKALAGSRNYGGCYIPTSSLELGNHSSRYTILSTCQGLKIGNGDNPLSGGENPSKTWKNSTKGLNCILGYSNNMADEDQYGEYLLANIKDGTTPLAKAFMDASESVSTDNIPAVMCFGPSEQDAADFIQNNTGFDPLPRANSASAWVYRVVKSVDQSSSVKSKIPAALRLSPLNISIEKLAKIFLGSSLTKTKSETKTMLVSDSGEVTFDHVSGTISVRNNLVADIRNDNIPLEIESEQIARHALVVSGILKAAPSLSLSAVAEEVQGGEHGISKILARKYTFKQNLDGAQSLSQQGSVDVTVGPGGVITEIKAALVQIDASFKAGTRPTEITSRSEDIEATAIEAVANRAPGANYRVIKRRIGYDAGNFMKSKNIAPAVVEVTVEASSGEFSRRFIEKIVL